MCECAAAAYALAMVCSAVQAPLIALRLYPQWLASVPGPCFASSVQFSWLCCSTLQAQFNADQLLTERPYVSTLFCPP